MPAICPPDTGPAGASAVEAAITTAMSKSSVPSISYALISCGKVYAANAHGTASPNVAASSATLYQAASISKTLAAVGALCAMQTNAKGCTLDSDVTAYQTSRKLPSGTTGVTLLGQTCTAIRATRKPAPARRIARFRRFSTFSTVAAAARL
jgi:CubicO group peptidase (beta-lactamase class C family)